MRVTIKGKGDAVLHGCLAMGMVPGSRPGLIRPADKYHKQLIEELLKRLPDEPAPPTTH